VPTILVYFITSEMVNTANVLYAAISRGDFVVFRGKTTWKRGNLSDLLEFYLGVVFVLIYSYKLILDSNS
jgi:hypothetical protein